MGHRARGIGVAAALCAAIIALIIPIAIAPPAAAADPETVTGAPMTRFQTNGRVLAMELVNGIVYVGGNFTRVRPAGAPEGTQEVVRRRLAAFDANTGDLLPWAPSAQNPLYRVPSGAKLDVNCTDTGSSRMAECASVFTIKSNPSKTKLYVGGDFDFIDGKVRQGIAEFDLWDGSLDRTFQPRAEGRVKTLAVTNSRVFAGGDITRFAGVSRNGLAAVTATTGDLLPWAPSHHEGSTGASELNDISSLVITPDESRVIVGGGFDELAGAQTHGIGAVDPNSGAALPWASKSLISSKAGVTTLNLINGVLYSTSEANGSRSEGVIAFDPYSGNEIWYDSCKGASHSMTVIRGVVYVGSHSHDCGAADGGFEEQFREFDEDDPREARRYTLRAQVPNGRGGVRLLHWFPRTNDGNGAFAMASDNNNLWVGGEFTTVDERPQTGLIHYKFAGNGGADHTPYQPDKPRVYSTAPGRVNVTWQATEDADDLALRYVLVRDGTVIHEVWGEYKPWNKGWFQYIDSVAPGSTHQYALYAVDPKGAASPPTGPAWVVAATGTPAAAGLPAADGASAYYSFDDTYSSTNGATKLSGSASFTAGAHGKAISLSGGGLVGNTRAWAKRQISYEMMFRTTTDSGGVLASMGTSGSVSASDNNLQTLYMSNDGRLNFGVFGKRDRTDVWAEPATQLRAATTAGVYNDGNWHHVAAVFSPGGGIQIYVDGALAAQDASIVYTRSWETYLHVGLDKVSGWPNASKSAAFNGVIDDLAVYPYPLSADQAARHAAVFRR